MAALALGLVGSAMGVGPLGGMVFGLVGSLIDKMLFSKTQHIEGPKLDSLSVTSSTEGMSVTRTAGIYRVSPQLIWATNLEETTSTQSQGKGGMMGGGSAETTTYNYFGNFAVALGEGRIDGIGKVWADGKIVDMDEYDWRLYRGSESQNADPLITQKETESGKWKTVPAFRGTAYIVFERMPLEKFGNRIPNLSVEVIRRPVSSTDPVKNFTAISIAGASEFALDTELVQKGIDAGPRFSKPGDNEDDEPVVFRPTDQLAPENSDDNRKPNFLVALDVGTDVARDVDLVAIESKWWADDLRAGVLEIRPRVSSGANTSTPHEYNSAGQAPEANVASGDEEEANPPVKTPRQQTKRKGEKPVVGATITVVAFENGVIGTGTNFTEDDVDKEIKTAGGQARKIIAVGGTETVVVDQPWDQSETNVTFTIGDTAEVEASVNDASIKRAIELLKDRGFKVMFTPQLGVDVPPDNDLPDPYSNYAASVGQPAYPFPGRITPSPAKGFAGDVDTTAAVTTQINAFFGAGDYNDFGAWIDYHDVGGYRIKSGTIDTAAPTRDDWGYRRFVLHHAKLCKEAGFEADDVFIIGSGLKGITLARSSNGTTSASFPAIAKLQDLAEDCRAILGAGVKISYAADVEELIYHINASNVAFPLDALWAHADIDFVGINNFLPLSDWRTGTSHLDYQAGAATIYNADYLTGNVRGGEYFRWTYADDTARNNQTRTTIVDPLFQAASVPTKRLWMYRRKDIRGWWSNFHYRRVAGAEVSPVEAWIPESKPIWFTAYGCPAIDKGTNQPDAIYDPESDDGASPYFSTSDYDPTIQYQYFAAMQAFWGKNANNPQSSEYDGRMLERMIPYTMSADPNRYIEPRSRVLNAMMVSVPMGDVIRDMCDGMVPLRVKNCVDLVRGFYVDGIMSPRRRLEPLMQVYLYDAADRGRAIEFFPRRAALPAATFTQDDLVLTEEGNNSLYDITRTQETELPRVVHVNTADPQNENQAGNFMSQRRRDVMSSERSLKIDAPILMDKLEAKVRADAILNDAWVGRERAEFSLPPSTIHLGPADVVSTTLDGRPWEWRLSSLGFEYWRPTRAMRNRVSSYSFRQPTPRTDTTRRIRRNQDAPVSLVILDLPRLTDEQTEAPWFACYSNPWNGAAIYRTTGASGFRLDRSIKTAATMGRVIEALPAGPLRRWDNTNILKVRIPAEQTLESKAESLVMEGQNLCAVRSAANRWELIQFVNAELVAPGIYHLSKLLRGVRTTDDFMGDPLKKGAAFVMIDDAVVQSRAPIAMRGVKLTWRWGPANVLFNNDTVYQTQTYRFMGVALRPPSPISLKAARQDDGDLIIRWKRRSRTPSPDWDGSSEVSQKEDKELYRVRVYSDDGVDILSTVEVADEERYVYTRSNQLRDFGAPKRTLTVGVAQKSMRWGWGEERKETIGVPAKGTSVLAATAAIIARASSPPPNTTTALINSTIQALVSGGVWAKLDGLYIFTLDDPQLRTVNWRNPGTYDLTQAQSGGGFGDPAIVWNAKGVSQTGAAYLSTGYIPADAPGLFGQDSNHVGAISASNIAEDNVLGGSRLTNINPRNFTGLFFRTQNSANGLEEVTNRNSLGHYVNSRLISTEYKVYKDSALLATHTASTIALTAGDPISVLNRGNEGAGHTTTRKVSAFHFGSGLTAGEVAVITKALNIVVSAEA